MEKQVNTMQVDFSEKEPSQKYHNVLSCIIKSNLCDAFMYEHKMHVEYKISRLFERLILKSFHFKECHHVCQSRACQMPHTELCRPTRQKYKRCKDMNGFLWLLMTQREVKVACYSWCVGLWCQSREQGVASHYSEYHTVRIDAGFRSVRYTLRLVAIRITKVRLCQVLIMFCLHLQLLLGMNCSWFFIPNDK